MLVSGRVTWLVTHILKKNKVYVTENVACLFRELPTISTTLQEWILKFRQIQQRNPPNWQHLSSVHANEHPCPLHLPDARDLQRIQLGSKKLAKTPCKLSCKRLPVMSSNQQRAYKTCISTTPQILIWGSTSHHYINVTSHKKLCNSIGDHPETPRNSYNSKSLAIISLAITYSAKGPWNKSLNLIFPIKYICNPKKFKGWPLAESDYIISTKPNLCSSHRIHHLIRPFPLEFFQCLNLAGPGNSNPNIFQSSNCLALKVQHTLGTYQLGPPNQEFMFGKTFHLGFYGMPEVSSRDMLGSQPHQTWQHGARKPKAPKDWKKVQAMKKL